MQRQWVSKRTARSYKLDSTNKGLNFELWGFPFLNVGYFLGLNCSFLLIFLVDMGVNLGLQYFWATSNQLDSWVWLDFKKPNQNLCFSGINKILYNCGFLLRILVDIGVILGFQYSFEPLVICWTHGFSWA